MEQVKRLNNAQFFAVCEELRNQRELISGLASYSQVMEVVAPKLGFIPPRASIEVGMRTVGVSLAEKVRRQTRNQWTTLSSRIELLAQELIALKMKLGEPVTAVLSELAGMEPTVPATPLARVTLADDVRVANRK